ncbi:hypothetical protein Cgig2_015257 [Carnegiea gigantea]|uniref:Uncharacterized protein n=1 Tax=Carnegiea gigantea TaxID=171969 RepID=A0A9Q1KIB9_9CARY|nr:hypothetical protein Cgig2_015257 [Carnegiea gigantea]
MEERWGRGTMCDKSNLGIENTTGGSRKMAISKDSNKKMQQSSIASKSKKKQAAELGTAQNSSEEKQAVAFSARCTGISSSLNLCTIFPVNAVGKRNYRKKQKAEAPEVEDDIEEFISASEVSSDFEKKGSLLYEMMINDYNKYNSSLISYIEGVNLLK